MKPLNLFILALIALSVIGSASAEIIVTRYDHNAFFDSPYQTTRVCGCGSATDYFTLENVGDFPANFQFTLESEADWIQMQREYQYLQPGEKTQIAVTLTPACGVETDTSYRIYAQSQFGRFRAVDRQVTAHTCESINFHLEQAHDEILPCETNEFSLTVQNTATFTDTYYIDSDPETEIEQRTLELAPGESETVQASRTLSCDVSGPQEVNFYVTSKVSENFHEKTARYDINRDYEFQLAPVGTQDVCAEVSSETEILITNIAQTPNTYFLSVDKDYASLSEAEFDLQPGLSKRVKLTVEPTEAHVGEQNVQLTARTENGDLVKTLDVPYEVSDCYEHTLHAVPAANTVCAGMTNFTIQLANRGDTTERYSLQSDGDLFSQLSAKDVVLRPGERADILLNVGIPDMDADWTVNVHTEQTPGISSSIAIPITSVSNAACTEIQPTVTEFEVHPDHEVIPIILEHRGIEAATYELSYEGDLFTLAEESIFLAPGEQGTIHLVTEDKAADLSLGEHVQKFTATSHRAQYRDDFEIEVEKRTLWDRFVERAAFGQAGQTDWCFIVVVILTIIAALMLIGLLLSLVGFIDFELGAAAFNAKSGWQSVLLLIALIALVAAAIAGTQTGDAQEVMYEEPFQGSNYSQLYHEFAEGETYRLDLDRYFIDPDNEDALSFADNQPEHLDIKYEGSTATIRHERGFTGQDKVVFTAIDQEGATADSPIMSINVIGKVRTTFGQFVADYCLMIAWLLVMIMALTAVGLLAVARKREDRTGIVSHDPHTTAYPVEKHLGVPATQPRRGTQVSGDVVAGDKVTYVGKQPENLYIGSKNGGKAHKPTCGMLGRINTENRRTFKSKEGAIKAGYTNCKVCRSFEE